MAQFNTGNNAFQAQAKTIFEVNQIATIDGNPVTANNRFPVDIGNTTINISGNVNINTPNTVTVNSTPEDPVHVHITEVGNSGTLAVSYVPIGGNVVVTSGNVNANVSGNVVITSGSVDANVSGNVVAFVYNANGTAVSNTAPLPITGNININTSANTPAFVKYADSTNVQLDATQRLRVAMQGQQWWYRPTIDKDGDLRFIESFAGTGANSFFVQNLGAIRLTSGNTYNANTSLTGQAIRISRRRHKIRPGASHQWFSIHNWQGITPNVTKRRGMFTQYNGIFFEVTDDLYCVIRRRLIDGTLSEDRIPRSSFSHDKLDGTGESGLDFRPTSNTQLALNSWANTANVTVSASESVYNVRYNTTANTQTLEVGSMVTVSGMTPATYNGIAMVQSANSSTITLTYQDYPGAFSSMSSGLLTHTAYHNMQNWYFDFSGGATSKVRFGIHTVEGPQIIHIADYTGMRNLGTHFENAPALVDRTEIINTGIPAYIPSFTTAGTSVNVEAELELNPGFATADNNTGVVYTKTQTQEFAILGIGLRAGEPYQRADLQIQNLQIQDIANVNPQNSGVFFWRLVLNPTLGGDYADPGTATQLLSGKASRHWHFTTNTTFSGGIDLMSGYFIQGGPIDVKTALNFLNTGSNIQYTDADKIVLIVKCLAGGSADSRIVASMNFIEAL